MGVPDPGCQSCERASTGDNGILTRKMLDLGAKKGRQIHVRNVAFAAFAGNCPFPGSGGGLETLLEGESRLLLESAILPAHLSSRIWFKGADRKVHQVSIQNEVQLTMEDQQVVILLVEVSYESGLPETYVLALTCILEDATKRLAGRGIYLAARVGAVRLSPHFYNTLEQCDRCLEALRELAVSRAA